ncbi:LOW QUALITY PROTEIN: GRIP and coiled-coil domain-containing protein 2-like [Pomacea canaliculata]|uniref:LOW QUALITY PROTEIN: GRIP and coiled-coil domain-containing protein 2-like n=1 Tax=Pomacea canaliculata TaxID=400727 RepID=UPI000D726A16|nr:LOW QUALITY PROTEIN: GRIP and coiled-coil domain-containing protein 2-like [Pomacea canaliculata]
MMADDKGEATEVTKSPAGSKLESLSREDLIKFVKKQLLLLQRERTKAEDLQKKLTSALEVTGNKTDDTDEVQELKNQLQTLTDERDEAINAYNTVQCSQEASAIRIQELEKQCLVLEEENVLLQQRFVKLESKNKELIEQLECMEMKDASLKSSLQCMQEEQAQLAKQNKELEVVKSNQEALIADLENSLREIGSLEEEHEILKHKLALAENCIEELKAALKNKEVDALQESSTEEQLMCKVEELRKHSENLFTENEQLKIDLASKIAELSKIRRHAEVETLSEHLTEKQEKQISKEGVSEVSDSESLISELRVQLQIALDQLKELSSQKEAMKDFWSKNKQKNQTLAVQMKMCQNSSPGWKNQTGSLKPQKKFLHKKTRNSFGEECCARQDIHNDDTNSKDESAEDLVKMAELKANLQLTIVERQKLFEELAHLREVHETAAFELAELQQEHDSLKTEADQLRGQLGEWEHLMDMVKRERDSLATELETTESHEDHFRQELELIMNSMHEALAERDSLQDEVFRMTEKDGSLMDEITQMKSMTTGIIAERDRLQAELDSIMAAKGESSVKAEVLACKLQDMQTAFDNLEREKESTTVLLQLAQEKESQMIEELAASQEKIHSLETSLQEKQNELNELHREQGEIRQREEAAKAQVKTTLEQLEDRKNYTIELEEQVFELSNSLTEAKKRCGNLREQFEAAMQDKSESIEFSHEIEDLHSQKAELEQQLEKKMAEFLTLQKELSDKTKLVEQVEERCTELVKDLEKERKQIAIEREGLKEGEAEIIAKFQELQQELGERHQHLEKGEGHTKGAAAADDRHAVGHQAGNGVQDGKLALAEEGGVHQNYKELEKQLQQMESENVALQEKLVQVQSSQDTLLQDLQEKVSCLLKEKEELGSLLEEKVSSQISLQQELAEKLAVLQNVEDLKAQLVLQLDQITAERDGARAESTDKETECQALRQELATAMEQLEEMKIQVLQLHQQLKDVHVQKMSCDTIIKELREELDLKSAAMSEVEEASKKALIELANNSTATSEVQALQQKLLKAEETLSALIEQVAESEAMNKKLQQELREMTNKNACIASERDELVHQVESLKELSSAQIQQLTALQEENADIQSRLASLVSQIDASQDAKTSITLELQQSHSDLKEVQQKFSDLDKEHVNLTATIDSLIKEKIELEASDKTKASAGGAGLNTVCGIEEKARLDEKCASLEQLVHEKEHGRQEMLLELEENTKKEVTLLLEEKQVLVAEVTNQKKQWEEVCGDLQAAKEEVAKLRADLAEKDQGLATLRQSLYISSEKLENFREDVLHREQELDNLRSMLADKERNFEEAQVKMGEALKALEDEVKLQKQLREKEAEKAILEQQTKEQEEEKQRLESRIEDLESAVQSQKAVNAQLCAQMVSTQGESMQKSEDATRELQQLKKAVTEKDEMIGKLKQLALKSKKELQEVKAKLESANKARTEQFHTTASSEQLVSELRQLQETNSILQQNIDSSYDELEQKKAELSQLAEAKGQMAELSEERTSLSQQLEIVKEGLKTKESDAEEVHLKLKASEMELSALRIQLEDFLAAKQKLESLLVEKENQLEAECIEHKTRMEKLQTELTQLQSMLTAAKQDAKQSDMLDLEMADYERTIHALNEQLTERNSQLSDARAEIIRLEERLQFMQNQIEGLDEQRQQAEERGNKLKQLLVKAKKDLSDAKAQESEQKTVSKELQVQIEKINQQLEDYKVQMVELGSENQRLLDKLRTAGDVHQRTIRSLEGRIAAVSEDLEAAQSELRTVQSDYESYKVRAQSVLQKTKTKSLNDSSSDLEKQEKQRLENAVEHLKGKLQEMSQKISALTHDNETLQEEHERLQQRHNKLLRDSEQREEAFRKRVEEMTQDKMTMVTKMEERAAQLQLQLDVQKDAYKEQLESVEEEHKKILEMLQMQLDMTQGENTRLQREVNNLQRSLRSKDAAAEERRSPPGFFPVMTHPEGERQEGEGSEVVDAEPRVLTSPSNKLPSVSFEKLLATPLDELPTGRRPSVVDEETLKNDLTAAQKKIEHLTELLNDSEESVSRMTEQAKILKDEIRRLNRNQQRDEELQNLEYLKNIIMKFLTRSVGEERMVLVPVLHMMLKLSPEEKEVLEAVATGEDSKHQKNQQGSGWGSYLHRWSGLT